MSLKNTPKMVHLQITEHPAEGFLPVRYSVDSGPLLALCHERPLAQALAAIEQYMTLSVLEADEEATAEMQGAFIKWPRE